MTRIKCYNVDQYPLKRLFPSWLKSDQYSKYIEIDLKEPIDEITEVCRKNGIIILQVL